MQGQRLRLDSFAFGGALDQYASYQLRFAFGYGPADNLATENVNDGVEEVELTFHRPRKFRYIPRPAFIGPGGLQYRHGMLPPALVAATAPVTRQTMIVQQAVHGADAAQVNAFIEQLRVHLLRS